MKAEDITDEMLVGLADGELKNPNPDEVYKLVLSDDNLLVKFSNYVETGHLLREGFSSQDIANSDNKSLGQNNVVSFADAKDKKSLRESLFNTRSLFQMAAALMIGVISGPVLMNNLQNSGFGAGSPNNPLNEEIIARRTILEIDQLQKFENIYSTRSIVEIEVDIILKSSSGKIIFPGANSDLSVPFKLELLTRSDGQVTVRERLEDGSYDIWMEAIEIQSDKVLSLPAQDFFKLTEVRDTLLLEVEVNSGGKRSSKLFVFGNTSSFNETDNLKAD